MDIQKPTEQVHTQTWPWQEQMLFSKLIIAEANWNVTKHQLR